MALGSRGGHRRRSGGDGCGGKAATDEGSGGSWAVVGRRGLGQPSYRRPLLSRPLSAIH
jgi:hypothetical protein